MSEHIAEIRAIDALEELVVAVRDRPVGSNAGIGVFYGASGFGKTTAIAAVAARYNIGDILVAEGQEHWKASAKGMLHSMLKACDYIAPQSWSLHRLQDAVVEQILAHDGTMIVDEADMACCGSSPNRLEILRNIHDALGHKARLILIGEELLPNKLQKIERVANRVLQWQPVPTVDDNDLVLLLEKIDLDIEAAVLREIAKIHRYRIRTIISTVERIKDWAAKKGVADVKSEHWDDIPKTVAPKIRMELV